MSEPNMEKIRGMSAGQFVAGLEAYQERLREEAAQGLEEFYFGDWRLELIEDRRKSRIAEAQRAYDMAKPGEAVQIDADLLPYINRTEK